MDPKLLELGNIHLAITEFRDGTGRKSRPVLVLGTRKNNPERFEPEALVGYITSQNHNKNFEKYKYPIADWKAAGLDKESWVVLQERELKWMNANKDFQKHVGMLSERDTIGVLKKFIEVREVEKTQTQEQTKPQPRKGKMQVNVYKQSNMNRTNSNRGNNRER
ncbi:type II toxin-antitoxin system PemK/MazF family toxin [Bacillus swezeyi]|uniref:type II toxin-antitoxin system PemK/MazF family toxin n=1 Tax=Bacillus swezeyi TaxID=1925020 RepID=UPI002EAEF836|nr:type II toxin-antitoxin system PemK/MazF family toxin [Bacillus swezeyi]